MTTLHTLNAHIRTQTDLVQRLLRSASAGDALLLTSNGIYNLTDRHFLHMVNHAQITLYAMQADVEARGLSSLPPNVIAADDALFVALACEHKKVVSWF